MPAPPTSSSSSWPERTGEIDRERPVVLYCRGGNRSDMAAEALAGDGYDAVALDEGIPAWVEAGRPGSSRRAATSPSRARPPPSSRHGKVAREKSLNTLIPVRFCYFPGRGGESSTRTRSSTARARTGTLENPETYENVPGHVIPIIEREFDDFDNEAEQFLAGELPEDQFIGFRLKQGVYGQRQPDVQMVRVKLPFGGVTPEQMEAFASVVENYAPLNKGHITTRQNIQIHHVPLRDTEVADPRDRPTPASPRARAAATRSATSPAIPGPASRPTRSSTRRPTPAPTSATSSATRRRS